MMAIPPTDEELAATAQTPGPAGQEALGLLLERHARRLHQFFALRFRDAELATDLVQEVFERVIRARERAARDQGFRPWLWTIAVNLAHSQHRRHRAAPSTVSWDATSSFEDLPLSDRVASETPSPRQRVAEGQRAGDVHSAIAQLDESQRDVIQLKFFEDLPCAEVAQVLGVSEGTVWSRTHRALVRMREILGPEADPRGGDVR